MERTSSTSKTPELQTEVEYQKENEDGAARIRPDEFGFSAEEQKKIIRRVDYRLIVTIGLMYCISLVDRVNMGAANLAGMGKELALTGTRYVGSLDAQPSKLISSRQLD